MSTEPIYMREVCVFLASDSVTMEMYTRYAQLELLEQREVL